MSVEQAIIQLVVEGSAQFDATNTKIQADLTATERQSKSAESAAQSMERSAKNAEQASRLLIQQVTIFLAKGSALVGLGQRLAQTFGADRDSGVGQGLDALQGAFGGAAQGASIGKLGGPTGILAGAGLGALIGIAQSLAETEKRLKEHADKIATSRGNAIQEALLREAGLSQFDHSIAPGGRHVQ